jgi:hypothetical protein
MGGMGRTGAGREVGRAADAFLPERFPMRLSPVAAGVALALAPCLLVAQTRESKLPAAVYWMSLETAARTGADAPAPSGRPAPAALQGGKRMRLDLGSSWNPEGEPRATHTIPPELMMGERLPLVRPARDASAAAPEVAPREPDSLAPRGRTLVYWGCGEAVGAGQPMIVDYSKRDPGSATRPVGASAAVRVADAEPSTQPSYGTWPNQEHQQRVPEAASLRGLHVISGNYTPDMQFSIEERHDFMQPVEFVPIKRTEAGALLLNWKGVPNAVGYFALATGSSEQGNDTVIWSSSELPGAGPDLLDYLPPEEVDRLVKDKLVLGPQTNTCTVPAGIFKQAGAQLHFIAYGEEMNLVHPARPKEAKQPWEPLWALKIRLKSTAVAPLAEGAGAPPRAAVTPSSSSGR